MDATVESSPDEVTRLRGCLSDLVSVTARPAVWSGGESSRIVGALLDTLLEILHLDVALVRLNDPDGGPAIATMRVGAPLQEIARARDLGALIESWLEEAPRESSPHLRVLTDDVGLSLASARLGLQGEIGVVVAGSLRLDFPRRTERLLLDVTASQAAMGLQQARLLGEQKRLARALDERVALRTRELARVNEELAREVEERRRAETAAREIKHELRHILDTIPGMVGLLSDTGYVEVLNHQLLEYFGQTLEELRQWGTNGTVHPEDIAHVADVFTRSIAAGSPYTIVQRFRRADGAYRWFENSGIPLRDETGRIVRWYVLLTDIDERKRAEEALAASERNLKLTVDTIPALAWSTGPDGSADFFNQHYLDFVGLSAAELAGWGWTGALHPDDLNGLAATWQRLVATGEAGEAEARLRRRDGAYRWFLFRASPLRDEHGSIVRWFGVNTDIEDRKQAEDALHRARSELAHVARVSTLSAVTASIAHEVNQPLAGIVTNASTCLRMLDAEPPDLDGARETARRTIRDGHRASDVIARLRALFGRREFTPELMDLNEATREVLALSSNDLQTHRVILRQELADDLPPVVGDRVQLQQVILNLLLNAAEAMGEVHDRARELTIGTQREGGECVRLTVRDAGVGVEPRSTDELFDAFHSTKSGGMGIGLWISRSIIERHHGRLWVEAHDGPGATFAFVVPCRPEGGETASAARTSEWTSAC